MSTLRLRKQNMRVHVCTLSRFSCVRLFVTPWTVARQAPLSVAFSRQEDWSGLPCPPPGDLPDPGIKPTCLVSEALAGRFLTTECHPGGICFQMGNWTVRNGTVPLVTAGYLIMVGIPVHTATGGLLSVGIQL